MNRKTLPNEYRIRSDNKNPNQIGDIIIKILNEHKQNNSFYIGDYNKDDYFTYISGYSHEK